MVLCWRLLMYHIRQVRLLSSLCIFIYFLFCNFIIRLSCFMCQDCGFFLARGNHRQRDYLSQHCLIALLVVVSVRRRSEQAVFTRIYSIIHRVVPGGAAGRRGVSNSIAIGGWVRRLLYVKSTGKRKHGGMHHPSSFKTHVLTPTPQTGHWLSSCPLLFAPACSLCVPIRTHDA